LANAGKLVRLVVEVGALGGVGIFVRGLFFFTRGVPRSGDSVGSAEKVSSGTGVTSLAATVGTLVEVGLVVRTTIGVAVGSGMEVAAG